MKLQNLLLRYLPENTSGSQEFYPRSECGTVIVVSYLSGVNVEITGYSGHGLTAADTDAGCEHSAGIVRAEDIISLRTLRQPTLSPAVALTKQPSNPQYFTLQVEEYYAEVRL